MLQVTRVVRYLLAFLLLGLAWSASVEAGTKSFTLTAPAIACPGQQTLRVELKNTANQQQLGSAEITIPTGLVMVGTPSLSVGTATPAADGRTVRLEGLGLQPRT